VELMLFQTLTGAGAVVFVIASTSTSYASDWIPDFLQSDKELFCQLCEATLSDRLKSPSSYKRSECAGPYSAVVNERKYVEYKKATEIPQYLKRSIADGEYSISETFLKYEAANSYGAQIRGTEICEVMHRKGQSLVEASRIFGPKVGGFNKIEWSIETLRRLNK
jgi:hypothetical protein